MSGSRASDEDFHKCNEYVKRLEDENRELKKTIEALEQDVKDMMNNPQTSYKRCKGCGRLNASVYECYTGCSEKARAALKEVGK